MTKFENVAERKLKFISDERGWLLKILMRQHIDPADRMFGEIYLTAARRGQVKGNHYHRRTREWFCLVQGRARLVTRDMESGETKEIVMSADEPSTIEVAPGVAHAIQCAGGEIATILAYADQPYDPDDLDEVRVDLIEPANDPSSVS